MTTGRDLVVRGLTAGYGRMAVVHGVDLQVRAGEMVALLGRNGAGKSTALAAIAGLRHGSNRGEVLLGERSLAGLSAHQVVRAGLALVPEGHRLFPGLTVEENLRLGAYAGGRPARRAVSSRLEWVHALLPALASHLRRPAGDLSGGQQQMVAIGQALMSAPDVLLLDEPSSGLAPAIVDVIYTALTALRDSGQAVLLVEQSIERALEVCARAYVLERGSVVLGGSAGDLRRDEAVARVVRGVTAVDDWPAAE